MYCAALLCRGIFVLGGKAVTRARLLKAALLFLVVAILHACGGGDLPTPTPVATLPPATPMPSLSGAALAIPTVVVPWMASRVPQQALQQVSAQARKLPTDSQLGPPQWVKPGTRITFYQAAASIAESRFAWVEDPNGTWTDPTTGKHYRRTDESGEGVPTASGDGFTQIDVLAIEGTDVVLSTSLYPIDHLTNQFFLGGSSGAKVRGDAVDGSWINPTELAQLQNAQLGDILVLRGDYVLNGATYHAISFATTTPGAYQSYTYDTQTGLLLSATTNTAGATSNSCRAGREPAPGQHPAYHNASCRLQAAIGAGNYRQQPRLARSDKQAELQRDLQFYEPGGPEQRQPYIPHGRRRVVRRRRAKLGSVHLSELYPVPGQPTIIGQRRDGHIRAILDGPEGAEVTAGRAGAGPGSLDRRATKRRLRQWWCCDHQQPDPRDHDQPAVRPGQWRACWL